ncbi:MAG: hypothetical protein ACYSR0_13225 [Planctomycetota bacterium]
MEEAEGLFCCLCLLCCYLSVASVYYVVTLLPVLGIIQAGEQAAADRYTYLPSLGPFLLLGLAFLWVKEKIYEKWKEKNLNRLMFSTFSMAILVALVVLTRTQSRSGVLT